MDKLFLELYSNLPQQGPGLKEETIKAFNNIPIENKGLKVLDIGCGSGRQTMDLARVVNGKIKAVDFLPQMNAEMKKRLIGFEYTSKIDVANGDMGNLNEKDAYYDIIWSEGAIYNLGFEKGLAYWKQFLKPKGFMAITEAAWLTDKQPKELHDFWMSEYPDIKSIDEHCSIISSQGYELINSFPISKKAWEVYYAPLKNNLLLYKKKYKGNTQALAIAAQTEREIQIFEKYADYYGYVFYIMSKL